MQFQNVHMSADLPLCQSAKHELDESRSAYGHPERRGCAKVLIVDATGEIATRVCRRNSVSRARLVCVQSAEDAYLLVRPCSQFTVVIHPNLPGESGWLAAAKLRLTSPQSRIWMYGDPIALPKEHLAAVGATGRVDDASVGSVIGPFLYVESGTPPSHKPIPKRKLVCP